MFRSLKSQFTPFLQWWPDVNRDTLRADGWAALTGAIVVLPQGIAFASIAGMPPEYGLYAAMIPAVVAALFGSSRLLVSGPTTAASIVLFSSLSALAIPGTSEYVGYAITLTLMVGVIQLALGVARLGVLVNFVSHPVIVGFTAGAAILIAVNQLEHFLGAPAPPALDAFATLGFFAARPESINPLAALVGLTTLAVGLASRRLLPRLPYMLPAIAAGTAMALLVNAVIAAVQGDRPVELVGAVAAALPPLSVPDFSLSTIRQLAPVAFAVTLFALAEAVSIARSLAARSGQFIDGNQEFIGQGLSNIVGSFFSSYVATGSFNRSALNYEAGACTPLAAIFAAGLLVGVVGVSAPALAYLPRAAMAGVLFLIAWSLVDFRNIRRIARTGASEAVVLWMTFGATLLFDLEFAIILGVMLSLVVFLRRASRPSLQARLPDPKLARRHFVTDPDLPECPQLKILRVNGPIFFGAVNYVAERLRILARRNPRQKHLLLLARSINFVDVAGAELLAREARHRRAIGGGLYLHQLKEEAREPLERGGYLDEIGRENVFESKGDAIETIFGRLDRNTCTTCALRVFRECHGIERGEGAARPEREKAVGGARAGGASPEAAAAVRRGAALYEPG